MWLASGAYFYNTSQLLTMRLNHANASQIILNIENAFASSINQKSGKIVWLGILEEMKKKQVPERVFMSFWWMPTILKNELLFSFRNIALLHVLGSANMSSENYSFWSNQCLLSNYSVSEIGLQRCKDEVGNLCFPLSNLDIF